jgi:hypothetical protein
MIHIEVTAIITPIITAIGDFVSGLGAAFLSAFQTIFMNATVVEGVTTYSGLNPLGIFLLVFFGISLGYGVIRWITGLFRREAN